MAILEKLKCAIRNKKVIFLDLDNTLYAYEPCHRFALKQAYTCYCRNFEKISWAVFAEAYRAAREIIHRKYRGKAVSHSRLFYFQLMLGARKGARKLERAYWDSFLKKARLRPWVKKFLPHCKASGKKIGVITNLTTDIQRRKWNQFKLYRYADFLLTSEDAGVEKPHRKIFQMALKKAKARPRDVLLIGDDSQADKVKFLDCFLIE